MTERTEDGTAARRPLQARRTRSAAPIWQRALGWLGLALAAPFFVWAPLAAVAPVPSMIDVFGVVGLRIPASITIAGLLLAAVGFHRN